MNPQPLIMPPLFDLALARLHLTDVEYAIAGVDGLSNHGPMALESLVELGAEDRVLPFLAAYETRLRPLPASSSRAPTLGDPSSARAFLDHYESLLSQGDWRPALVRSLEELMPAAVAGAAHGWLRTAHAVRALVASDVPVRRRELAFALASWAARFQRLPGVPGAHPERGLDVVKALGRVPLLPREARNERALIIDRVEQVNRVEGFSEAIEAVDLDALPIRDAIGVMTAAAARLFLATPSERFVYLHTLTATSALRLVEGAFDAATMRRALGAVFHAVAALHATFGDAHGTEAVTSTMEYGPAPDPESIRGRACASLDDHDVKLAAAALREYSFSRRPELLAAAAARLGM